MGELPFFRAHTALHPDHLWIWEKAVYVDENQRTWLPVTIEIESSLQVLMRQEDVPLGDPVCPSQLGPYLLPVMWQLYPGRRYRGSDSSFWRIVYHIEASDTEDMLLEQMPDPESCSSHLLPPPEPHTCRGDVPACVHLRGMGPTRLSLVFEPLDQLPPVVPAHT
ncbi:T-cell leukemia/lymphoma protein 1A [Megaptera novaeangliae]